MRFGKKPPKNKKRGRRKVGHVLELRGLHPGAWQGGIWDQNNINTTTENVFK
jgi:hypothetical protein